MILIEIEAIMESIKSVIIILLFNINANAPIPSYNPLGIGAMRTEILEDIWEELNNQIRGVYVPPGPPDDDIIDDEGEAFNAGNTECGLRPNFPGMRAVMWQNVPNNGHEIHFRKDILPRNFGRDPADAAPVNAIFASRNNNWTINNNAPQGVNGLGTRYNGVLGVAICRRQQIEFLRIFPGVGGEFDPPGYRGGYFCDIDTWLLFLCMRDDDVQQHNLRDPEDYNTYLGGRSESEQFKDMASQECSRRIGATPKEAKISRQLSVGTRLEYAQRVYVMASRLANYDFILIRKRRVRLPSPNVNQNSETIRMEELRRCRGMSLLQNNNRMYRRVLERPREVLQKYDFRWFFCHHITGSPLRNIPVERKILKGNFVKDHHNLTDVNMLGKEL